MEKVLITGGAGYLGNMITRKLLARGHRVECLDNFLYRQYESVFPLSANPNYVFRFGDARDERTLRDIVPKYDVILPLAAIVGAPASRHRPIDTITVNRDAAILINSLRSKDQKFIFPNTNSGYGTRTHQFECDETTPLEPISLYGTTKCDAEKVIREVGRDNVVFRLASVFGVSPRMRLDLSQHKMILNAMKNKIIPVSKTEAYFTRNYIYIGDVADAFLFAMDNYEKLKNEVYNAGCDSANIKSLDLARKIADKIPGTVIAQREDSPDEDRRNYLVSNEKLRKAGFEAKTTLDYGIEEVMRGISILNADDPFSNL